MAERIESYTLKVWRIDEWIDDYTDQISQWELVAQEHVRPAEPIILARCTTPTEAEAEDVIPRLLADGSAKKAGA